MSNENNENTEIRNKVSSMIAEYFDKSQEELNDETSFTNDLGADSLDLVELVMKLEEEFGIEIQEGEASKLQTVKDVIELILEKIS